MLDGIAFKLSNYLNLAAEDHQEIAKVALW
jgi:hypothetical protein